MDFMGLVKKENDLRKTLTENCAVAYETTGKEILDFNFRLTAFRQMESEEISDAYGRVYFEDPLTAVKFLFWVGDSREGAGERKVFRSGLIWLANNKPEIMKRLIPFVGEYNRFDSLLPLLDTSLRNDVSSYLNEKIEEDFQNAKNNKSVSLTAKWLPSENASSATTRRYARMLCDDFGWSPKRYRKTLADLRSYLDVVERKTSSNRWDSIKYETVPSKANLIYSNAFLAHDEVRRLEYLESLKNGKTKINAGVLQPHEIVTKYCGYNRFWIDLIKDYDETLEQLWNNLPNETINETLVVRDGSYSMTERVSGNTTCLNVATALTIYMSERNSGSWRNKFITFSSRPTVVDISNCSTLHDKLVRINEEDDCSNTDIYGTMNLILETAVNNNIPQEEMPKLIVITSDQQFDGTMFNFNQSLFEDIRDEFEAKGYKLPKICFWNIDGLGNMTIPLQNNELGLILCSGFSVQIMKMFMSTKLDPYAILIETINAPRYDAIERAVKDVI